MMEAKESTIKRKKLRSSANLYQLSSNEQELKPNLYYHISNPIKRWKTDRSPPFMLILQVAKTICIVVQVILFMNSSVNRQSLELADAKNLFECLLLNQCSAAIGDVYQAYSIQDVKNIITSSTAQYSSLLNSTVYGFDCARTSDGALQPIEVTLTQYAMLNLTAIPYMLDTTYKTVTFQLDPTCDVIEQLTNYSEDPLYASRGHIFDVLGDLVTITGTIIKINLDYDPCLLTPSAITQTSMARILLGIGILLQAAVILRFISYFQQFNAVYRVLYIALPRLGKYIICALILFLAFMVCGWLVMSPFHYKFTSFGESFHALYTMMHGDDLYSSYQGITASDDAEAYTFSQFFFTIFLMLFNYVMLNLMISLIMDSYEESQKEDIALKNEVRRFVYSGPLTGQGIALKDVTAVTNRPADVLVHNWSLGKPAAFDFCVTSPLNSLILSEAGVSSGEAAQASEIRKHNSNDAKCVELGWVCIPLVVETYGAWGQEAVKTFAQLASRLAIACSKPKSVVINEIYGRLNTCLMRSISSAILTRIVSS
ncbi:hypothetical protein EMCRGX_G031157 [Ephydatia muelleri]